MCNMLEVNLHFKLRNFTISPEYGWQRHIILYNLILSLKLLICHRAIMNIEIKRDTIPN